VRAAISAFTRVFDALWRRASKGDAHVRAANPGPFIPRVKPEGRLFEGRFAATSG
jgi:hypothetical protein